MTYFYDPQPDDVSLTFSVSNKNVGFMVSVDARCVPVQTICAKHFGGEETPLTLRGDQLVGGAYYIGVYATSTT
jgi:hypothetical protein